MHNPQQDLLARRRSRSGGKGRGRPAAYELPEAEGHLLRAIVLGLSSSPERLRKTLALEQLIRHEQCSDETRAFVRERIERWHKTGKRPNWPVSIMRAAHVTEAEILHYRGKPKDAAPYVRRGDFLLDKYGRPQPLAALMVYVSDDFSVNEPYRWTDPASGQVLASRQCLSTADWHSAGWLGHTAVARRGDAYRAEDIADHFLDVCENFGLPTAWVLEQGSWAGNFVKGIEVEGLSSRWGALDPHLFHVRNVDTSGGKGLIEERFDMLQTCMTMRGGVTLGRHAGEFKAAAKLMRRVGSDRRREDLDLPVDPKAVQKLWSASQMLDALTLASRELNARPVERHWSPQPLIPVEELRHAAMRPIPREHLWRFCPVKLARTVKGGMVTLKAPGYELPFHFAVSTECATMDDGYKVLCAFHPGRPEEGCWIANRESGAKNRHGWGMGEVIFRAAYQPLQPVVDLSGVPRGTGLRAKHGAAVRTEFRPIREAQRAVIAARVAEREAEAAPRRIEQRTGTGQRAEIRRGTAPSVEAERPAATVRTSSAPKIERPVAQGMDYIARKARRAGVEIEDFVL